MGGAIGAKFGGGTGGWSGHDGPDDVGGSKLLSDLGDFLEKLRSCSNPYYMVYKHISRYY